MATNGGTASTSISLEPCLPKPAASVVQEDDLRELLEELLSSKLLATVKQLRSDIREDFREIVNTMSLEHLAATQPNQRRMSSSSTGASISAASRTNSQGAFSQRLEKQSQASPAPAQENEWMLRHRKSFIAGGVVLPKAFRPGNGNPPSRAASKTSALAVPRVSGGDAPKQQQQQQQQQCDGHLHVPARRSSTVHRGGGRSPKRAVSLPQEGTPGSCVKFQQPPSDKSPRRPASLRDIGSCPRVGQGATIEAETSPQLSHSDQWACDRAGSESEYLSACEKSPSEKAPSERAASDKAQHHPFQLHTPFCGPSSHPSEVHSPVTPSVSCTFTLEESPRTAEAEKKSSALRGSSAEDDLIQGATIARKSRLFRGESHVAFKGRGQSSVSLGVAHRYRQRRWWSSIAHFVTTERFDIIIGFLICAHAVVMGIETDMAASRARHGEEEPLWAQLVAFGFSACFVCEVCLRVAVSGMDFFVGFHWPWNVFDVVVVTLHFAEEVVQTSMRMADKHQVEEIGFFGILQCLRLVRILRVLRVVQYMTELRSMLLSVVSTLRSLVWTLVMLFLLIYMASIFVTQQVAYFGKTHPERVREGTELHAYFGSIGRCVMSLFQAITNGVDWRSLSDPLTEEISPVMAIVFAAYIAFMTVSLLNVITGMFVESALEGSRLQADADIVNKLRDVFAEMEVEEGGLITWQDFKEQLDNPRMLGIFRSIDLDPSEAQHLFALLDLTDSGSIDSEDFLMGCLRLRGPAKSIDLATLMSETRRMNMKWKEQVGMLTEHLATMRKALSVHSLSFADERGCV